MKEGEVFSSPLISVKPRKLNGEWDYISSPISNFNLWDSDNIDPNHPNLLLKSANVDIEDNSADKSTKQSRCYLESSIDNSDEFYNEFSVFEVQKKRKIMHKNIEVAPLKKSNKRNNKEILKTLDRKEFSWPSNQINEAFENNESIFTLSDFDDGLSLEDHISKLKMEYKSRNNNICVNDVQISKIINDPNMNSKNFNTKNVSDYCSNIDKLIDDQKEQSWDQVNILFTPSQFQSEYFKEFNEITRVGTLNELCSGFFQRFNKLILDKPSESCKTVIKVNLEPVFPLRTTVDYLWSLYDGVQIKVAEIKEQRTNKNQSSVSIFIPKLQS